MVLLPVIAGLLRTRYNILGPLKKQSESCHKLTRNSPSEL